MIQNKYPGSTIVSGLDKEIEIYINIKDTDLIKKPEPTPEVRPAKPPLLNVNVMKSGGSERTLPKF